VAGGVLGEVGVLLLGVVGVVGVVDVALGPMVVIGIVAGRLGILGMPAEFVVSLFVLNRGQFEESSVLDLVKLILFSG